MILRNFLLFIFISGCTSSHKTETVSVPVPKGVDNYTSEGVPDSPWAWDYDGLRGFMNWPSLNPAYEICGNGRRQSPINLKWQKPSPNNTLRVSYQPTDVIINNKGFTFSIDFTRPLPIYFNNREFQLESVEFHSPSEHQLSNKVFPIEVQMYHRSPNGLLILSSFLEEGQKSSWFETFLNVAKTVKPQKTSQRMLFDPQNLLPSNLNYYQYSGSLTYPPCSEGIERIVFNTPQQVSRQQILILRDLMPINNRPVQPLYGRKIKNY